MLSGTKKFSFHKFFRRSHAKVSLAEKHHAHGTGPTTGECLSSGMLNTEILRGTPKYDCKAPTVSISLVDGDEKDHLNSHSAPDGKAVSEKSRSASPVKSNQEDSSAEKSLSASQNAAFQQAWNDHIDHLQLSLTNYQKERNEAVGDLSHHSQQPISELLQGLRDLSTDERNGPRIQKCLQKIAPYLKSVSKGMVIVQFFSQADPTASLVCGLVKGVIDYAIKLGKRFDDMIDGISHLLELLPAMEECGKQEKTSHYVHEALVAVYKDLLAFYREAQRILLKPGLLREADQTTISDIVDSFDTHTRFLNTNLQVETNIVVKGTNQLVQSLGVRKAEKDEQICLEGLYQRRGMAFRRKLDEPAATTCTWVFDGSQSVPCEWRDGKLLNILVMVGDVGCGKTTLARSITDSLETHIGKDLNSDCSTICAFFCKDEEDSRSGTAILRAFLHQMASHDHCLLRDLTSRSFRKPRALHSVDDLEDIFSNYVRSSNRQFFLVVDGFDECEERSRNGFLRFLTTEVANTDPGRLKILLLCRPYQSILSWLPEAEHCKHFQLGHIQRQQMKTIVKHHVEQFMKLRKYGEEVRQLLTRELWERAEGCALWVTLALTYLYRTCATRAVLLEEHLQQVNPADLRSAYSQIFGQVPGESRKLAERALNILAGSARPLSLDELSYAMTLNLQARKDMTLDDLEKRCDCDGIIDCLGPLIQSHDSKPDSKVYLVHQSLKDLIMWMPPTDWNLPNTIAESTDCNPPQAALINNILASLCITYLRLSIFEEINYFLHDNQFLLEFFAAFEEEDGNAAGPPPFFEYASVYWPRHFAACSQSSSALAQDARSLSEVDSNRLFNWSEQYRRTQIQVGDYSPFPSLNDMNPLVAAAYFGHHKVVAEILGDTLYSPEFRTAAHNACIWASRSGQSEVLKIIVGYKDYPDLRALLVDECLCSAAENGYEETVKTILNIVHLATEDQIIFKRPDGNSALSLAVKNGYFEIVQLLIDRSPIPDQGIDLLFSAVPLVQQYDSPKKKPARQRILEMLVYEPRIDLTARSNYGVTILSLASQLGCVTSVEIILDSGRSEEIRTLLNDVGDKFGRSPLWHAVHWRRTEIIKLLCSKDGIETQLRCVDSVDGDSAIVAAARYSNREIVRILLDIYPEGVEDRDNSGRTPLSLVSMNQRDGAAIAQTLLESAKNIAASEGRHVPKADVESVSKSGSTPLDFAVWMMNLALCRVLIVEGKADWSRVVTFSRGDGPVLLKRPSFPNFDEKALLEGLCQFIAQA